MNNEEEAIEMIKRLAIGDIVTWFTTDGVIKMQMAAKLILKLYEDKKEEIYTIAKTNYILGQTDERSQWYKKISNLKEHNDIEIEKARPYKDTSPFNFGVLQGKDEAYRELIGKEE